MDTLLDQIKDGWQSGGKDSHFDWKAMGDVVLGEILKSDDAAKNKKLQKILDILTGGKEKRERTGHWRLKSGPMMPSVRR